MDLRRARLRARHEPRTDPDAGCTVGKGSGETSTISDSARCDDSDWFSGKWRFVRFTEVDYGGNED